ncbi:hypothetical protein OROGR_008529 [Orobanche gracilis]
MVLVCGRKVPREFPTIVNWTYSKLRERQNLEIKHGGFGCGYPCDPIEERSCNVRLYDREDYYAVDIIGKLSTGKEKLQSNDNEKETFADIFISKVRNLADAMVELMELVEDAQPRILEDENLKRMMEVSHDLISREKKTSGPGGDEVLSQFMNTQAEDEFWGNPERIRIIEEIENAVIRRNNFLKKSDDIPSFSLGLTQDGWYDAGGALENIDALAEDVPTHEENFKNHAQKDAAVQATNKNGVGVVVGENKTHGQLLPVEPFTHQMVRRDKNTIKRSSKVLSPFRNRAIDSSERLTKNEKDLGYYMLQNKEANLLHTIVNPPSHWDIKKRYEKFQEKLGAEVIKNEGIELKSIDMDAAVQATNKNGVGVVVGENKTHGQLLPIEPFTHQMVRRDKNTIKRGSKVLSPFHNRAIDSSERLTKNEKDLGYYMLQNKEANLY